MTDGNGHDRQVWLAQTAHGLARLPAKKRLDALIEAPESEELVRATPAEELYYAIAEVGLADAAEIVQLASPEQFRTFVDLGGWKRDRVDPRQVLTWLRAARGGGGEAFDAKLAALDMEVLEVVLRTFVSVHDREEDPDYEPAGVTMETPEGRYLLELHVEGPELSALRAILNDLIAKNPFEAVRLLEATRWDLPSELEEIAYRFRSGRLEDLGFPPLDRAVSLFAWLDPEKVSWTRPPSPAGAALVATSRASHLEAALAGLGPEERESTEAELRALANSALVAEVQDPGDLEAVRSVAELTRAYLSLGLEFLCGGDIGACAACLREVGARKIFQIGFSLTLRLKFRVDRLAKEKLSRLDGVWLALPAETEWLESLRRKRPMRPSGGRLEPFRSRADLDAAAAAIDRAEAQRALFAAALGGSVDSARAALAGFAEPLQILGTERLFHALLSHAALDGTLRAAPVPASRLKALCDALLEGTPDAPTLREDAAARVVRAIDASVSASHAALVQAPARAALERLRDELAPVWLAGGTAHPALGEVLPIGGAEGL